VCLRHRRRAASPWAAAPPHRTYGAAAYSRVRTGVHYPLDVIAGAVAGVAAAQVAAAAARRLHPLGLDKRAHHTPLRATGRQSQALPGVAEGVGFEPTRDREGPYRFSRWTRDPPDRGL